METGLSSRRTIASPPGGCPTAQATLSIAFTQYPGLSKPGGHLPGTSRPEGKFNELFFKPRFFFRYHTEALNHGSIHEARLAEESLPARSPKNSPRHFPRRFLCRFRRFGEHDASVAGIDGCRNLGHGIYSR